jgi:hypothetical protein
VRGFETLSSCQGINDSIKHAANVSTHSSDLVLVGLAAGIRCGTDETSDCSPIDANARSNSSPIDANTRSNSISYQPNSRSYT